MKYKVEVKTEKEIEEYWVLRAILDTGVQKKVIKEREVEERPPLNDVVEFLEESNASFVSMERNYRFPDSELLFM